MIHTYIPYSISFQCPTAGRAFSTCTSSYFMWTFFHSRLVRFMFHWFKSQANAIFMRFFRKVKKIYKTLLYIASKSSPKKRKCSESWGHLDDDDDRNKCCIFIIIFFFSCYFIFLFFFFAACCTRKWKLPFWEETCECASCVCECVSCVCVCVFIRQPVKDLFISFINFVAGLNAIVFIVVVGFFNWINWQFGEGAFLAVCPPPSSPSSSLLSPFCLLLVAFSNILHLFFNCCWRLKKFNKLAWATVVAVVVTVIVIVVAAVATAAVVVVVVAIDTLQF